MPLPQFKIPEPIQHERMDLWLYRVAKEFERYVNEEALPAIAERAKP